DRLSGRADVRRALAAAVPCQPPRRQAGDSTAVLGHEPCRKRDDAVLLPVLRQAGFGRRAAEPVSRLHGGLQPVAGREASWLEPPARAGRLNFRSCPGLQEWPVPARMRGSLRSAWLRSDLPPFG